MRKLLGFGAQIATKARFHHSPGTICRRNYFWIGLVHLPASLPPPPKYTRSTHAVLDLPVPLLLLALVAVHLDAQIVAALLPVDLAVCDGEEVFDAERPSRWQLDDRDARRRVPGVAKSELTRARMRRHKLHSGRPGHMRPVCVCVGGEFVDLWCVQVRTCVRNSVCASM